MEGKNKFHVLISGIYWFLCLAGFSYQTFNISNYYFEFGTDSELLITIPTNVSIPNFVICFRYVDVLNFDLLRKKYPKLPSELTTSDEVRLIQATVTIADIFEFTPSVKSSVTKCSIKNPSDLQFKEGSNATFCNRFFSGEKFYLQEYMCYNLKRTWERDIEEIVGGNEYKKEGILGEMTTIRSETSRKIRRHPKGIGKEVTSQEEKENGRGQKNERENSTLLIQKQERWPVATTFPTTTSTNETQSVSFQKEVVSNNSSFGSIGNLTRESLNEDTGNGSRKVSVELKPGEEIEPTVKQDNGTRVDEMVFSYRSIAYALDRPGVMYSVTFDSSDLVKVKFLKAVIVPSTMSPVQSIQLTTVSDRNYDPLTKKANYSFFQSTYSVLQICKLPDPYDTGCLDYKAKLGYESQSECRRDCNTNRTLSAFSKVPFSVASDDSLDPSIHHVTNDDLEDNQNMNQKLISIESECKDLCKKPDCNDQFSLTKTDKEESKNASSLAITFEVSVPRKPDFSIKHRERITWNEFLVYVLSCFGIWFGLSVLSVNPFNLIEEKNERRKKNRKESLLYENNAEEGDESDEEESMRNEGKNAGSIKQVFCSEIRNKLRREMNREIALAARAIYKAREMNNNM